MFVTGCCELLAAQLSGAPVGELGAQPAPGAVQALTEPGRRLADHGGGLRGRQAVPGHEGERLSITLSQAIFIVSHSLSIYFNEITVRKFPNLPRFGARAGKPNENS